MKTKIYNLVIIDESGSMWHIKQEAIDSVNETIQTIRSAQEKFDNQEHLVTLVTFNSDVKTVYDCLPVSYVKELTDDSYHPSCSTALYDAMGSSITTLSNKIKEGDKVLVTVVTDGQENASVEYSGAAVKALVDNFKSKGWVFAYIGANHDVKKVGADLSISNVMSFEASSAGTKRMSKKLNESRENLYCSIANDDFCAEIANEKFF